ncbi:MAG: YihY/virulence factor BrkB family protein [Acidobacteriota bacterium]
MKAGVKPQTRRWPQSRIQRILKQALQASAQAAHLGAEVAHDTYRRAQRCEVMMVASGLAYITIVSIFPIMALSFVIFQAVGGTERLLEALEPIVEQTLTPRTGEKVLDGLRMLLERLNSSTLTAFSVIVLALSSMALFSSVEQAINRVWESKITRSLIRRITIYALFLTLGPVVFSVALGVGTSDLSLGGVLPRAAFGYPLAVAVFFAVYKWAPNRSVHWLPALVSAFFTATLWHLVRFGLRQYLSTVYYADYYGRVYGSVGIVVILVALIFVAWLVVLIGASLSVAIQKQIEEEGSGS